MLMTSRTACCRWLLVLGVIALSPGCGGYNNASDNEDRRSESGDARRAEIWQGSTIDDPQAIDRLQRAAEAGSAPAMARLARAYRDGDFGTQDPGLAASWFERLVAQGELAPKTELAELLLSKQTGGADAKRRAIQLLEERVEDGDPRAMILRANLMDNRAAGKLSQKQAFSLYRKAATLGSSEGLFRLGQNYFVGKGVDQDRTHAVRLWYDAADQGSIEAVLALGDVFAQHDERTFDREALSLVQAQALRDGSVVARSIADLWEDDGTADRIGLEPARSLYRRAAEGGLMIGAIRLAAWLEHHGQTDAALDWHLPVAISGNAAAVRTLFQAFGDSAGRRFDPEIMYQWLVQANTLGAPWAMLEFAIAAAGGHPFQVEGSTDDWLERSFRADPSLTVEIAEAFSNGRFGSPDNETAALWLLRGAQAGERHAMHALAKAHEEGRGLDKSRSQAIHWYRKAAERGDVTAMRELARLLLTSGDKGQARLAVKWLENAAEEGDVAAMRSLARTLMSGITTEPHPAGAAQWYRAAARAGDGEAHYQLGMMYLNGLGLEKDLPRARQFLKKALQQDVKQAAAALQMLDATTPN